MTALMRRRSAISTWLNRPCLRAAVLEAAALARARRQRTAAPATQAGSTMRGGRRRVGCTLFSPYVHARPRLLGLPHIALEHSKNIRYITSTCQRAFVADCTVQTTADDQPLDCLLCDCAPLGEHPEGMRCFGCYAIYDSFVPRVSEIGSATLPYDVATRTRGPPGAGPGALEAAGRRAYSPHAREDRPGTTAARRRCPPRRSMGTRTR